ncbi:MAG: hypothetical protein WAL56_00610 [Candidatus Sulfotelmatobacter sp.]
MIDRRSKLATFPQGLKLRKKSIDGVERPSAAKAGIEKPGSYRSGKPLRYPKARSESSFAAGSEDVRFPNMYASPARAFPKTNES